MLADVPATSSGLVATSAILSATEHSGETDVTADLLDGNTATAWVRTSAAAPDLSLALSGASVGEIWIRSGYCYNQNYYNSYDRPATVAVTIWYAYGQQSVTYRYTLSDAFLPTTSSADWSNGYQRLLLPEEYTGVTQIDLTIETVYAGRGNAGVAISDIALAADVARHSDSARLHHRDPEALHRLCDPAPVRHADLDGGVDYPRADWHDGSPDGHEGR